MKIYLDEKALRYRMLEKEIYTFKELCEKSGASYSGVLTARSKRNTLSPESYWLIADFLGCHVEELQKADWTE